MKRDMEFVRKILIDISEGKIRQELSFDSEEDLKYHYHLQIMEQAGLVKYKEIASMDGTYYIDEPRLTWAGNDYLDAIFNEGVWSKTKEVIKGKGMEVSNVPFEVIIELAKAQLKHWFGMD